MTADDGSAELAQLLARSAMRDTKAFAELYRRTSAKLFGVARRMLANAGAAEEALQDAYVRIWENAARFDPAVAKPMTWMIAIVRNSAIDIRRKGSERIAAGSVALDEVDIAAECQVQADDAADLRRLRECLARLNEQPRAMVLLAYHLGFSREELSARFDRPVATVKTILRRSLAAVRECLDGRA